MLQLTKDTNQALADAGEPGRLNEKAVGSVLTSLGLTDRKRTNAGYVLCLDRSSRKHIHDSLVNHGNGCPFKTLGAACDFCSLPEDPQAQAPASA